MFAFEKRSKPRLLWEQASKSSSPTTVAQTDLVSLPQPLGRVVRVEERGYGSALMRGIEAARGRYVIMGDADDS